MAEQIVNEFTVNRPIDEAWPIICDIERIAPCLPGAQLEEIEGDIYRGNVKVKLGAVSTKFKGEAHFVERDDANHTAMFEGQGPRHRRARQRRGRHQRHRRSTLAHQHQVRRHRRSPHHRQGRPVRARHHGRRQPQADRSVLAQSQHDARRAGPWGRRHLRRDTDEADAPTAAETPVAEAPGVRKIEGPAADPVDLADMAGPALLKRLGPAIAAILLLLLLLRRRR